MLRALLKRLALSLVPGCYRDLDAQRASVDEQISELAPWSQMR